MSSRTSVNDPECRPCTCVHCTFGRNLLVAKQNLAGDLAGHMFGHLVSIDLARDILTTFVIDGVVQIFEGMIPRDEQASEAPFDPHSEDVQRALGQAFEAAAAHDCIQSNVPERRSPLPDNKEKEKTYTFKWCIFPNAPFGEGELVSFLNEITDRAFAIARSHLRLATTKSELRHRFVAPEDKRHAVPLAYERNEEDMRPNFLLLPIEAFSGGGSKTVDEKYVNLTAARLVGESNEDLVEGLDRMLRYAHGLKCAQPWVYYVLGMTISPDVAVFSRGDPSDWEHLALMLWDGRGCIEFIRILLGLALADGVDLGQNPFVELQHEERTVPLADLTRRCVSSDAVPSTTDSYLDTASSDDAMSATSNLSSCHNAPAIPYREPVEKRHHSEIEEDDSEEGSRPKKHKDDRHH
jgi:hypothetical protein